MRLSYLQRGFSGCAMGTDQEGTVDHETPQPAVPKPKVVTAEFRLVMG